LAKESIRLIEEAEAAAYEIEIEAQGKAAEIIAEAKQRAVSAHDEAIAKARQIVEQAKKAAAENADATQKNSENEGRALSDKLKAAAAEKMETAVDIVIADIIN